MTPEQKLSSVERQKIEILTKVATYCLWLHVALIAFFWFVDAPYLAMLNLFSVGAWRAGIHYFSQDKIAFGLQIVCLEVLVHSVCVCFTFGLNLGFQYYLWAIACILLMEQTIPLFRAILMSLTLIFIFALMLIGLQTPNYDFPYPHAEQVIHVTNVFLSGVPMIFTLAYLREMSINSRTELTEMATLDPLTGLYNRRFASQLMDKQRLHEQHQVNEIHLVMIDIDHFKKINDRYGHARGDEVLKNVAAILREHAHSPNFAIRWGGEEFLLILCAMSREALINKLDAITANIKTQRFSREDLSVTVSCGVSQWQSDHHFEKALAAADEALYRSKASGRNAITYC
ncbi:diguanylate cyclase [Pseudoalteromonas luteoviolacea B = ATCC 29581]|nr:diguanylate cyclase [Pseudoalteromonas luteoviolacea B = ATCC 29581]